MFAKKKLRLRTEKVKSTENSDADAAIRILKIHGYRFVVGLKWELIKAQRNIMKEVRRIGRIRNLDVVALRQAEAIQAGFAPKTRQKLRGTYSLIVALASLMDGACIAVIPLGKNHHGKDEFTLLGRTAKGTIHPGSDRILGHDEIGQAVVDLRQDMAGNRQDVIPVYGDPDIGSWVTDVLDLDAILTPGNIRKDFRLRPLRWGMTRTQLLWCVSALFVLLLVLIFYLKWLNEQEQQRAIDIQVKIQQQEEVNRKARYKAALDKLRHPWINTSSVQDFLTGCEVALKRLRLSIEGWELSGMKCDQSGMSASYNRPNNSVATAEKFVAAVRKIYGIEPEVNFKSTSVSVFTLPHTLPPNGDDPMNNMGEQLVKVISLFQSVNIQADFSAVPVNDVKKNEQGEDLPLQDWQEYTFSVDTAVPPQLVFRNDEFTGVRIDKIIYEIGQAGELAYKITGTVYGEYKRK
ncbi:TPA: type 4b pilus protein PilO2 [Salmonella enterica]|uniref:Type 4b pilus protein PilO2 n=1 Tax=Salmonella enterica TaxID=28901 RepID=A0A759MEG5_SALER|nr:type 4b pilus protein PilO2 [Salmonella enterica]